jgi:beta-lactamase superfamily II metal-dependent hydrolase
MRRFLAASFLLAGCADGLGGSLQAAQQPAVTISEVMADPAAVPDERGEWFEVHNRGTVPVDLRGWRIASGNDSPVTISRAVVVPGGGRVVLARAADAGVDAAFEYGSAISLANGGDWLALRDRSGATVDSVAWRSVPAGASRVRDGAGEWRVSTAPYGAGDRGTPGRAEGGERAAAPAPERPTPTRPSPGQPAPSTPGRASEMVVRVLDVGQGDATLITNGTSRVLIDGGPDARRMGELLDSLELNHTTIDVVVLSHPHFDHHAGLRELFRRSRGIAVRYFFENGDAYTNGALKQLRDSVIARVERREMVFRDTDDPCANGRPVCTLTLTGGARLHVMRPYPTGHDPNDRSTPVKLVGPDSASFSMWLAGDAEHDALAWFDTGAEYDRAPGMRVTVLKANHHGSCNGVSARYLRLTDPEWVTLSLAARNDYGHAHDQAKAAYARLSKPWYRTDQNGTITFRTPGTPGGGYTVAVQRGGPSRPGPSDRASTQAGCNPMP